MDAKRLDRGFPEFMDALLVLVEKDGAAPLNAHPGAWKRVIDDRWTVWVNAHGDPQKTDTGATVPPYHIYVEYNGFPAGMLTPMGDGAICAGEAANEDAFIEAMRMAALEVPND